MNRALIRLPLAALAMLPGCGSRTEIEPGQWEVSMRIVDVELPPALRGAGMEEQMQQRMRTERNRRSACMDESEARDPRQALLRNNGNGDCSVTGVRWENGDIRGRLTCTQANGMRISGNLDGDYDSGSFDLDFDGDMTLPQLQGQSIVFKSRIEGRRIGECRDSGRDSSDRRERS